MVDKDQTITATTYPYWSLLWCDFCNQKTPTNDGFCRMCGTAQEPDDGLLDPDENGSYPKDNNV